MVEALVFLAFVVLLGVWLLAMRRTVSAALVYTVLGITVAAGLLEMQARPKPVAMEWRNTQDAEVLWFAIQEGTAILVLLDIGEPRLYSLSWDQGQAEKLLKAGQDAEDDGGTLKMRQPFEPSLSGQNDLFYADPQPAPPPKG